MNGSNELGSIIERLTENPEIMKTLSGIASNLRENGGGEGGTAESQLHFAENGHKDRDGEHKSECRCPEERRGDGCREGCDVGGRKRGDDAENLIRLLLALKPYVSRERCERIDGIVKILKLVRLSESSGLLKSLL